VLHYFQARANLLLCADSCSSAKWASGEPCLFQYPLPALSGITIQMAFDHCPNSAWPFVSVTCSGAACAVRLAALTPVDIKAHAPHL
jgi:hypothetical protein